jgi:hypothetical protein
MTIISSYLLDGESVSLPVEWFQLILLFGPPVILGTITKISLMGIKVL